MIATNEATASAAEVPFFLPLSTDPINTGLTGHVFVLGEVQIKLPGAGWTNATVASVVEKGFGRYCVQLSAAQTALGGNVYIRAVVSGAQSYTGVEEIGTAGGDIFVGVGGPLSFYLPNSVDPVNGAPITGHTFVPGEVQVCLPGGAYANATVGNISEVGFGSYELALTPAQTTTRGKAFIYALVAGAQRFEGFSTILNVGSPALVIPPPSQSIPALSPTVAASMAAHVVAALNRLPLQFRNQPNVIALVTALVSEAQNVETALWQLWTQRSIALAVGSQLDVIGSIVVQPRAGASDADYRRYLSARIATNRSSGAFEDFIRIMVLVINNTAATYDVENNGTATVVAWIRAIAVTDALANILFSFLSHANSGGVRIVEKWSNVVETATFKFDIGPGWDVGNLAAAQG